MTKSFSASINTFNNYTPVECHRFIKARDDSSLDSTSVDLITNPIITEDEARKIFQ